MLQWDQETKMPPGGATGRESWRVCASVGHTPLSGQDREGEVARRPELGIGKWTPTGPRAPEVNRMRWLFWIGVLVAIGWGIGQVIQRFLLANPPPSL